MIMTFRRLSAAALAALLSCSVAIAQDSVLSSVPGAPSAPAGPELTLEVCIARAMQKNFDLEIGRYNPQIAKDAIDVAGAGYEPVLTVSGTHGKNTTGATSISSASSSTTSDLRAGVSQQLYTGTTLSASSKLDRSSSNPAFSSLNPAYNADLTLSVRQNLLRRAGR